MLESLKQDFLFADYPLSVAEFFKEAVEGTSTFFYDQLRDAKRIYGTSCRQCKKVHIPPRRLCVFCAAPYEGWVQVSREGTLLSFTEATHLYGLILLDGADTPLLHRLAGTTLRELRLGIKVVAVFKEERQGNILDITHFKPLWNA